MVQYSPAEMSAVFHALGDPTRLAIFEGLLAGKQTATDLAQPLQITLTATLQHLKVLEGAGLARSRKVGRERRCEPTADSLVAIQAWAERNRAEWTLRLDALERYLKEETEWE